MPTQNQLIYYPAITDIVKPEDLPEFLSFLKSGIESILSKLYYKDYYFSKNISGSESFYSISIVSKKKLAIELPGTEIFLVLNPDFVDGDISTFPMTLYWNWEILKFIKYFQANQFSFSVEDLFQLGLLTFNISEIDALQMATNSFVVPTTSSSSFQQLVSDINLLYGSNIVINDYSSGKYQQLITAVQGINQAVIPTIFGLYIFSSNNITEGKQKLNTFFSAFVPNDFEDFVKEIIIPRIRATLTLLAAVEFPRKILVPYIEQGGVLVKDPDETNKTKFLFAQADFYADTELGIGYQMEVAGTLVPTFSEIGKTGLLIQIQRLKIDLSKTKNVPEVDAFGYPVDFVGVYADALSITLPPKWFSKDYDVTSTLRLGGYNLIVGSGGVTGTFALEAVPVINSSGNVTSFFWDKFIIDYPITALVTDANQNIVEQVIHDDQGLLAYINSLTDKTQYRFKYPFSVTEIATAAEYEFNSIDEFRAYTTSFYDGTQDYMWLRLGKDLDKSWRIGFRQFDISFLHGQVTSSHLHAALQIKKFKKNDGSELFIDLYGEWESKENFKLSATFTPKLEMNLFDILDFTLENATIGKEDDNFFIEADTQIKFPDGSFGAQLLGAQTIDLPAIRIYANGKFEIAGGNTSIPVNLNLNLGVVAMGVTAIHFGSIQRVHEGRMRTYNYVGFDGGLSVNPIGLDLRGEGIKFYYTSDNDEMAELYGGNENDYKDSYFHISTIEVDLVIPGDASPTTATAIIKGSLTIPEPGVSDEYRGSVSINLPKARIYGEAEMAYSPKYPAWFVSAFVKFPTPIPLGPLGITGFGGLVANRYVAEKEAIGMTYNDTWYDYYVAPQRGIHLDKFSGPEKTKDYSTAFSVGVGASIAPVTGSRIASLRAMVLLSIPSMFAIDAGLTILSEALGLAEDDPKEPPFYAFVIVGDNSLEFGAGANFLVNKKKGSFVHIQAEVQMGFFFKNQKPWYINFGTKNKPIQVLLFKDTIPIKASGFLMISASGIEAGARVEFTLNLLGVIKVWAIIEVGTHVSFERPQVGGYLYIEGGAELNLFIIKVSVCVSVFLRIELVKPFLIFAELVFSVKFKILFIKFKLTVKLTLKWEKDTEVIVTPVPPITYQDDNSFPDLPKEERVADMVKGVHMLTNEEFALKFFPIGTTNPNPAEIETYIPLDTFIDVKAEKGLIPTSSVGQKIGGHTTAASNFTDLIPPKKVVPGGHTLRQVKHQYSIENVEIKFHNGNDWVDYHPYKAIEPSQPVDQLKVGFWQLNSKQYDGIRILGTTPFSFMDGGQPGWFIPEQYGITASTLFCAQTHNIWHHSDVLNKPLGTLYYPPSQYPSNTFINGAYYQLLGDWFGMYAQGYNGTMLLSQGVVAMEVTNAPNLHGFAQSLSFSNNIMVITLPEESAKVNLKLSTLAQGVTIKYYKSIFGTGIYQNYSLITQVYKTQAQLASAVEYASPDQFVSKIEIIPDGVDQNAINYINAQIDQIWADATANANGNTIVVLTPQQQDEHDALIAELQAILTNSCSYQPCAKDEIICKFLDALIDQLNGCIRYVEIRDLFWDNWDCFLQMIQMIKDFNEQNPEYNLYDQLAILIDELYNYEYTNSPTLSGALQLAQIIFDQISIIGNCDCQVNSIISCKTSIQEVRWMTVLDYQTQQTIPSQPAINANFQQMIAGVQNHIQPIWKPNTAYCIHVHMKDTVNDGQSSPGEWEYIFGFKTKGPLGHFDKQTPYIEGGTKPEEYPITMLKSYIDMRRSYPNADGSLLGSKPLFYGHNQCKLQIFFTKPYVYHMFRTWEADTNLGYNEIKGSINIAIKDPIAQNQDIIPYPLPAAWTQNPPTTVPLPNPASPTWISDADPNLPLSIQVLNSFITTNNLPCQIDLGNPILPKAYSYSVTLTNLKPSKLYTAIIYNAFDDNDDDNYDPQTQGNLINYEENQKVHEYVFKTSRYANFEEQVKSYLLKEYDDDGNLIEERAAIYTIQTEMSQQQIDDMYKTVEGTSTSALLENISNIYSDSFDRVYEGVLGLKPLDPPNFTEFIRVVNQTNELVALIIRNPEAFNDPKTPMDIIQDSIVVLDAANDPDLAYHYLYSKDYSQVIIMHQSKKINIQQMNIRFDYLLWNGSTYLPPVQTVIVNNIQIND